MRLPFAAIALVVLSAVTLTISAGSGQARSEKTWRPLQVMTALRSAGLPIGLVRYYTASSDPNKLLGRPGQYTGKANFRDKRIREGTGFGVENGDRWRRSPTRRPRKTASGTCPRSRRVPLCSQIDYLEGTVFLRLSNELTPAQAKAYERAFRRAV